MRTIQRAAALFALCSTAMLSACGGQQAGTPALAPADQSASQSTAASGSSSQASDASDALGPGPFLQLDRLNRPAINEVFATFSEHDANNRDIPNNDRVLLKRDIIDFMEHTAGRSPAISDVVANVLTPDVQIVDLSGRSSSCLFYAPGKCNNYLGIETGGATQIPKSKPFGGRALTDDIVDISLSVIFGDVVPKLGLAPDDNAEQDGRPDPHFASGHRPNLTSDHVSYTQDKSFNTLFPYLGTPR